MKASGDHDSKSTEPTHSEIAERAHQLWLERGMPSNAAEQNWLDAERGLKAAVKSHSLVEKVHENAGSVQR